MRLGIFALLLIASSITKASVFEIESLSQNIKNNMIELKTWQPGCPIPLERLRLIKFSYYDFEGNEKNDGEFVVLDAVAKKALNIFKELHASKFPISKARPIEYYKGSDEASMADNNSSCYNCREITGGGLPSIHAYGLALDINPLQNPYISFEEAGASSTKILPSEGKGFINRTNDRPGMTEKVVEIFKRNGFTTWGGKWNTPIDWQHFQPPRSLAQLLSIMSPKDSEEFFELYADSGSNIFDSIKHTENKFLDLYKSSPSKFMNTFRAHKAEIFNSKDAIQAFSSLSE